MEQESAQSQQPSLTAHLPAFIESTLRDGLTRENIQQFTSKARSFAKEHPAQAAGLLAVAGLALWGLVGTKAGRQLVKTSTSLAMPIVTGWVAKNYESYV